jgi:hypothetical protein
LIRAPDRLWLKDDQSSSDGQHDASGVYLCQYERENLAGSKRLDSSALWPSKEIELVKVLNQIQTCLRSSCLRVSIFCTSKERVVPTHLHVPAEAATSTLVEERYESNASIYRIAIVDLAISLNRAVDTVEMAHTYN